MGLKSYLFGTGGKNSSSSTNVNNGEINAALAPSMGLTGQAGSLMSSLLGGDQTALNNFSNSGGMQFLEDQGQRMITSSKAAQGLLNSGSYGTALEQYGQQLGSTYLNQYLQNLNNMGQLGLGAGQIVAGAGQQYQSHGTGPKQGLSQILAGDLGKINISDRRLKKDIEKIGEHPDGLGKYRWTYIDGHGLPEGRHEGVMADEVKELRPWAYIPNFMGEYAGVNYSAL